MKAATLKLLAIAGIVIATVPEASYAQQVFDCDARAFATSIVEPWEENSRQFANGAVRVILTNTNLPENRGQYIVVVSPPYNAAGAPQCRVVGKSSIEGFTKTEFAELESSYDPAIGLVISVPVQRLDGDGELLNELLVFTLNQQSGQVAALLR